MDFSISLPKLSYGQHENIRNKYKYADDLINPYNWKENMSSFTNNINNYIDQRDRFATIRSKELRYIGLPPKEVRKTMDVFQTLSCDILNHYFFEHIGKIIEDQYEHYDAKSGQDIPTYPSTSEIDVDKLPKEISNYIVDISAIGNMLNKGVAVLVSPDKIEYHDKYLKEDKYGGGRYVAENSDLSKYGLYPEIVGTDIAKLTSNSNDFTSVAFIAGGLFDWKFVTPQQRSVGSAGDLGAIIIDILFNMIKRETITETSISAADLKKNYNYIFDQIKKYYNPLIESTIIEELMKKNEDLGPNPDSKAATDRNPVLLGVVGDEYRIPDIYALWCVYRSVRTPFYNGSNVKNEIYLDKFYDFFTYDIKTDGISNIKFEQRNSIFNKTNVDNIKDIIIKQLKGDKDKKSTLSINISNLVTEYNVPVTSSNSLAKQSIDEDVIKKLTEIPTEMWHNIISQAFTSLYLSLFIAADTDWANVSEIIRTDISIQRMKYNIGTTSTIFSNNDRIDLIKISNSEYVKYRNTLKSLLGTNKDKTMGGTSLINYSPISIQRYGHIISYPGDKNLLEGISSYLTMFFSDVAILENRLQQALFNMSNMYWYRDVLKWLEILFEIFKPHDAPPGKAISSMEVSAKFYQLEKVLKILYSKELKLMIDYIQKSNILQRRYESGGSIDKSLEKQIKLTSYYTRSTICYIKRQILIIYYLLDKSLESWWTTTPTDRKKRPISPAFLENDFKPAYRNMKNELTEWFRGQISNLTSTVTNPKMLTEIRNLIHDTCDTGKNNSQKLKTTSKYLQDEKISEVRTDIRFWLLLIANLKNKDITTISNQPQNLQRLYIPVYDNSNNFYLFDIMPLVLTGNYKGSYGGISAPQWLNADDLKKTKYSKNNSGIVIIANLSSDVAYHKEWKAISIEWLDKLVNKSTEAASNTGDSNRKLWLIRTGLYIMINDSLIYDSSALKTKLLTKSPMRDVLEEYQGYSNNNKNKNTKYLFLVSREYVKNEMNSSTIQFYNI